MDFVGGIVVADLTLFREKIREYYSTVPSPYSPDKRKATQADLVTAIHLDPGELSKRLNGKEPLPPRDVRAIVKTLADWKAITTRAQAIELLDLMSCPHFSRSEWEAEPLSQLTPAATLPPHPWAHGERDTLSGLGEGKGPMDWSARLTLAKDLSPEGFKLG